MSLLITERVSNIPMENREFIQEYTAGRPGIIDLSIGNPDLPTPAYIVNKSKEQLIRAIPDIQDITVLLN